VNGRVIVLPPGRGHIVVILSPAEARALRLLALASLATGDLARLAVGTSKFAGTSSIEAGRRAVDLLAGLPEESSDPT